MADPEFKILYAMPSPASTGGMRMITRMYYSENVFERAGYYHFDTFYSWGENKLIRFVQNIFQKLHFIYVLLSKRIDVVYVMSSSNWGFYDKVLFCLIARLLGKKSVLNPVGGHFILFYQRNRFNRFMVPLLLRVPNGVISGTTYWFDYFKNTFDIRQLRDIPNPVTVPAFSRKYHFKDREIPLTITFLARMEKEKGAVVFAEYARNSLDRNQSHRFILAGKGPALEEIRAILAPYADDKRVRIAGFVSEPEKNAIFEQTDVYILPTEFEVLPVSLLEAMSYECIVITTPVGGIPDAVEDGVTGFLLDSIRAVEIERIIQKIEAEPEILPQIGQKALEKIRNHYALETVLLKQYEFFRELKYGTDISSAR